MASVYDIATGERIARISGDWIDIHAYRDGLVWMTLRAPRHSDPDRLVTWNPDTDEVVDQGLRDVDGVDLDRRAAWRWSDNSNTKLRVVPLDEGADWEAWTSNGYSTRTRSSPQTATRCSLTRSASSSRST